jgi:hypothetical protein
MKDDKKNCCVNGVCSGLGCAHNRMLDNRKRENLISFHFPSFFMISTTLSLRQIYHFPNALTKITWFTREGPKSMCR